MCTGVATTITGCPIEHHSLENYVVYIHQVLHLKGIYLKLDTLDKSHAIGVVVNECPFE